MGEHLGVGVRREDAAALDELCAQRRRILDDAVVHDGVAACGIAMGVGVAVARLAMGRPARMADTMRSLELLRLQGVELTHAALALGDLELALVADRDASRVVAAILEPMQAFQQYGGRLTPADIADDSTHGRFLTVDDTAQLPPGVSRRSKTSARKFPFKACEDQCVRKALAL
jgi:hypothetical protein